MSGAVGGGKAFLRKKKKEIVSKGRKVRVQATAHLKALRRSFK